MTVKCGAYLVLPINGTQVKHFKSFPYLGSRVTIYGGASEDAHTHIKKVNVAYVMLYPVWRNKNISLRTKILLFNTNGKTIILYRCGTQKITGPISNSLPVFVN
jgi:ABC-type cobalt transport system substrate-binding protein